MRVLLIEDDMAMAQSLELILAHAGLAATTTDLGEEGVDLAKLYGFDVILLDLHLPDMSGHEVLRQLRRAQVKTPVLILTGDDRLDSKLSGFGQGADDFLTKPFHRDELLARVHALIRRSRGHAQSVIQVGPLTLDLHAKSVAVGGEAVHLTGKEYKVLELLALRKGSTVTKDMLLNHLYGGLDEPEVKIIDVFVCKIRKKLAEAGAGRDLVETVWARGYCLRETVGLITYQEPVSIAA